MTMGKSERRKGADFERLICRMARARGRQAERSAPMQAGCAGHGDVLIDGLKCECKHRDAIPQYADIISGLPFSPGKTLQGWLRDGPAIIRRTGAADIYIIARHTVSRNGEVLFKCPEGTVAGMPLPAWLTLYRGEGGIEL
jgi:hypothetical protein